MNPVFTVDAHRGRVERAMGPFRYRRRVAFGECDPARIFFAPRAIDYAVEAVEAWSEAVLVVPWADLVARHGREAKVTAVDCAYQRSLVAGQVIEVVVELVEVGTETMTLSAIGELAPGDVSFRASVALCLSERGGASPLPIPAEYHERLAAHGARSVAPAAPADGAGGAHGVAVPARSDQRDGPPSESTFTRQRRVRYGDCGVSGDAYPPKVVEWAVEAVGEWYEERLGISWLEQCARGRGTPFLAIRCEYLRRMEPGLLITMAVSIPRLGRASIGYAVVGRDERGVPCFEADMSACFITEEGGPRRSMPFPDGLRERILAYQAANGTSTPGS